MFKILKHAWCLKNVNQIGLLGTDIQNFGAVRLILYIIYLFKKYDQYRKKFFSKTVLFYVWIQNFEEIYLLGKKWKTYDTPHFHVVNIRRGLLSSGALFLIDEWVKTNISAKFDACIRNVNVSCILLMSKSKRTSLPNLMLISEM